MIFKLEAFLVTFTVLISICHAQNDDSSSSIGDGIREVFLSKSINSTDSERLLKSARESYSVLKKFQSRHDDKGKVIFIESYANFLLKLFNDLKTKKIDIYQLFGEENSFLAGFREENNNNTTTNDTIHLNVTEVKTAIDSLQIAVEKHLVPHYMSSDACFDVPEILSLNDSEFDVFLKQKFRSDFSNVGYFFLEVFATLVGLSWGVISTVLYGVNGPNRPNE